MGVRPVLSRTFTDASGTARTVSERADARVAVVTPCGCACASPTGCACPGTNARAGSDATRLSVGAPVLFWLDPPPCLLACADAGTALPLPFAVRGPATEEAGGAVVSLSLRFSFSRRAEGAALFLLAACCFPVAALLPELLLEASLSACRCARSCALSGRPLLVASASSPCPSSSGAGSKTEPYALSVVPVYSRLAG